jgi:hypothetical protein
MKEYLVQLEREKLERDFHTELRTLRARLRYSAERGAHSDDIKARLSVIASTLEETENLEDPVEIYMLIIDLGQLIIGAADLTPKTPHYLVN